MRAAPNRQGCREKTKELLNRLDDHWKSDREAPQRHNLWHTPRIIKRNRKTDLLNALVLYNPDTITTHDMLGGIKIIGNAPGLDTN